MYLPITHVNKYAYTANNPGNLSDPSGESFLKKLRDVTIGFALGGITGAVGAVNVSGRFTASEKMAVNIVYVAAASGGIAAGLAKAGALAGGIIGSLAGGASGGITSVAQGGDFNSGFQLGMLAGGLAGSAVGGAAGYGKYGSKPNPYSDSVSLRQSATDKFQAENIIKFDLNISKIITCSRLVVGGTALASGFALSASTSFLPGLAAIAAIGAVGYAGYSAFCL